MNLTLTGHHLDITPAIRAYVPPDPHAPVWTDHYSNILGVLIWR